MLLAGRGFGGCGCCRNDLAIAPALASVLVPAAILQQGVFPGLLRLRNTFDTGRGILLSPGMVLAVNVGIALPPRFRGIADLDALVADGLPLVGRPAVGGTVGYFSDGPIGSDPLDCRDLCQRLLLSGTADRVVVARANSVPDVPVFNMSDRPADRVVVARDDAVPAADRHATIW